MQITRIKVEGLYGLHDYEIPFSVDENIKIIHAPNGYGKTTLLKLISDIINCKLFEISVIPFSCFSIEFDNFTTIQVIKESKEEAVIKYIVKKDEVFTEYIVSDRLNASGVLDNSLPIHYIENNLPFLKRIAQTAWYDTKTNEKVSYDEVIQGYGEQLFVNSELAMSLDAVRQAMPVHFIHANRLVDTQNLSEGRIIGRRKNMMPSVLVYSKELADRIDTTLAQSAEIAQELDRTFPARLIAEITSQEHEDDISLETINNQLQALEQRRLKLEKIGLLSGGVLKAINNLEEIDSHTLKVLKLYIKDSQTKLDVFDNIETKMNLMREIINKRFNYKTMQFNKQKGFIFELPNKSMLSPDKLSSGEQNELILIFELLFKSQANSLILIDEPEISLHIAWQQQFLEDMQAISDLTDVKIIIATHSPDIINGRWDLTTGLEEC
ncbi:AAA family ATPase [Cellulosilyticum sp. I15G10I2]|uniref:AAA family ATPase n=1 Tax=Cellulosilyticum sp. I15G10I2 TaxID=1892843 RepID=UPI00085C7EB0|nr:AAA family ATPase [Cellulosilyticum sp. I15G10I2]